MAIRGAPVNTERLAAAEAAQREAAAERVRARSDKRALKIDVIRTPGRLAEADEPERIVSRIDRLSTYYPDVRPVDPAGVIAGRPAAMTAAGAVLERIINTPDFVSVRYLEAGERAARAVGRIDIGDGRGRVVGYGTGSLVSRRLLLTNHHVLPDAATAAASSVEFRYEDGVDGKPLKPVLLPLDPTGFFLADEQLDFALVAIAASEEELRAFGFNRLIAAEGKAIPGDFVTIVQHPRGEKKQVALRDNRVVDVFDDFLHYQADTEPGSSGSPVFNDQWEIVGLHHAGVPAPEHTELGGFVNEGIRVSRILAFIAAQPLPAPQRDLADQLRSPEVLAVPSGPAGPSNGAAGLQAPTQDGGSPQILASGSDGQNLSWALPLELAVELRAPRTAPRPPTAVVPAVVPAELEKLVEPFHDADLSNRPGYDANFLGIDVPMPSVKERSVVALLDDDSHFLHYQHFSIVMNKRRRLALFTASNVDAARERKRPEPGRDYSRRALDGLGPHDQELWFTDPRIVADEQLSDRFFSKDRASFDKGHLVRREDAAWGDSYEELRRANGDTFHITNCSPQVADFNRSNLDGLWGELENIVLDQAATERYCLFAGPLLLDDDPSFSGVDDAGPVSIQIPRQFWKIVVARAGQHLQTFAFLLDQDLSDTKFEFAVPQDWRTRMVSVAHLEELIRDAELDPVLHASDQIDAPAGEAIRAATGMEALLLTPA